MKDVSQRKLLLVSSKTNGRCFYCNKRAEVIDHFVSKQKWLEWDLENTPLKGGLNDAENLVPACRRCNSKKSDSCPEDFMGNGTIAWDRYLRANHRIGLMKEFTVGQFVYGEF